MKPKPAACDSCPFASQGRGYAAPTPVAQPALLAIGQGPGQVEANTGIPFHPAAPAGRELRAQLAAAGWPVERVVFDNATRCWIRVGKSDEAPQAAIAECYARHWGAPAQALTTGPAAVPVLAVGTPIAKFLIGPWAGLRTAGAVYERTLPERTLPNG